MTQTVLLGDICDVKIGRTPPRKESQWFSSVNGNKWVSIKDMGNSGKNIYSTSEYLTDEAVQKFRIPKIDKETLLLSFKLTVGRLGFATEDMYSNEAIAQLPIKDAGRVYKDYLYYYLKNFNFDSLSSTSSIATAVNSQTVKKIPIKLPDIETQKKIADILGSLDEKIELNRQMNETLEQMGRALFRHYFIDNPEAKNWEIGRINDIAEVTDYVANGSFASLKKNVTLYDIEEFALYIRTTDYKNGFNGNLKYVDQKSYDFLNKSSLDGSEFIISNVGDVGTVFKAPVWLNKPMTLASNVIMVRDSVYNNYLYLYFRGDEGQFSLSNITAGSAQPKFNKTEFRNLKIKRPDINSLTNFNTAYDIIGEQLINNNAEIRTLTTLRDTLLPRLINGKMKL